MRTHWKSLLGIALLTSSAAIAGIRTVYKGTIGKAEVVMELSASTKGGALTGRYFYMKNGVDIPLTGTLAHLEEPEPASPDRPDEPLGTGAVWSGAERDGFFTGRWSKVGSSKRILFRLKIVGTYDPDPLQPGAVQAIEETLGPGVGSGIALGVEITPSSSPYLHLKLGEPMIPGQKDIRGPVAIQWLQERRTGISYPRLIQHPDARVMKLANRILASRHEALVLSALECASTVYERGYGPAAGGFGGFDEEKITVSHLSRNLMSVIESGSTFCGGAHPNNHFEPYTLDLRKGEYLDFKNLIRAQAAGDSDSLAAWEQTLIEHADKLQPLDKEEVPSCREELAQYLAVYVSSGPQLNLAISGIGHALGCCLGDQVVFELKDFEPLLTKAGRAYFELPPMK